MFELFSKMGVIGWPLLLLSIAMLTLIIHRFIFFSTFKTGKKLPFDGYIDAIQKTDGKHLEKQLSEQDGTLGALCKLLFINKNHSKLIRDELVSEMLEEARAPLYSGVHSLRLIAVVSPLVGLLGTVLGMILAFQDIAITKGPVNPSLLADGLWVAMLTTAYGLVIALPSIFAAHFFQKRADTVTAYWTKVLNRLSLAMEGAIFSDKKAVDIMPLKQVK